MLLARDMIVGIFIPSSISLLASLFTRSVIHHLVTTSLVIYLQAYDVYYREGPKIPLRYSEWQILISIYANPTNTFGDTCRVIRPFCIMILYQYLLHYGLLLHIISQYLWLFSIILQGLPWRGGMPVAGILAGKGANIGNLFCTAPKILKLHETYFWN